MLYFISRLVVGVAVLGFMVGAYHLFEGPAALGGYVVGASVGTLTLAALLEGVARAVDALEKIARRV